MYFEPRVARVPFSGNGLRILSLLYGSSRQTVKRFEMMSLSWDEVSSFQESKRSSMIIRL